MIKKPLGASGKLDFIARSGADSWVECADARFNIICRGGACS